MSRVRVLSGGTSISGAQRAIVRRGVGALSLLLVLATVAGCVQFSTSRTRLEDDLRRLMTAELSTLAERVDKASVEDPGGSIDRDRFERSLRVSIIDDASLEAIESVGFSLSGILAVDVSDDVGVVDFFVAVGSISQDGPWTARGSWFGCGRFEVSFTERTTAVVDAVCPDSLLRALEIRGAEVSVSALIDTDAIGSTGAPVTLAV